MALIHRWARASVSPPGANWWGRTPLVAIAPGETVLRTHWSFSAYNVLQDNNQPWGNGVTKFGLVLWDAGASSGIPTPISQPDADWIDLQTAQWVADQVEVRSLSETDWIFRANSRPPDIDSKAMRKNEQGIDLAVWLSWETQFGDSTNPNFAFVTSGAASVLIGRPA